MDVLHGLLTSIPTFWGPTELTQISRLYIDHHATSEAPLMTLMKTVAKRAPTAVLISALADIWPSLQASPHTVRLLYLPLRYSCVLRFVAGSPGRIFRASQTMLARRIPTFSSGEHSAVIQYLPPSIRRRRDRHAQKRGDSNLIHRQHLLIFSGRGSSDISIHRACCQAERSFIPASVPQAV